MCQLLNQIYRSKKNFTNLSLGTIKTFCIKDIPLHE